VDDKQIAEISSSKPRSLFGNASWSAMATVWSTLISFFFTPFLISQLGIDHYGLYALVLSISGMLGIMDLGLGEATLRYVSYYYGHGDIEGINRSVGATLSVYVVMGVLGWAVLFFCAPLVASLLALPASDFGLATGLMRLTAINFGLAIISGVFGAVPKALQRYDLDTGIEVAQGIIQIGGTIVILLSGRGIYEVVLWSLIVTVLRQIANVVVAKRLLPALRLLPLPSRNGLNEVLSYGVFATITQTLGIVAVQIVRLSVLRQWVTSRYPTTW
jgi:O-antigen/teichoic acid export membrane protein